MKPTTEICLMLSCLTVVFSSDDEVQRLKKNLGDLTRQVMMQQVFLEEKIRADGDSGIKQCRIFNSGTKTYHNPSTRSKIAIAGLHDHSKHIRTVGIGEFVAVLNGVEFRTRHNDFLLRMPSTTSKNFLETENIPFPDVPPEVTSKPTVEEQIQEMRKWFKAFQKQDHRKRDYRKYFKPVLCYLEGTWIDTDYKDIVEPFISDRHFLDARSFKELQDKIMFTSYGGRKSYFENYAWLPTTIMDIVNETTPKYGQWIYRTLCHPMKRDIPTNRFRMIDDLSARMMYLQTMDQYENSREARFQVNSHDRPGWKDKLVTSWEFLDDLMGEIPGLDNYGGNLTDESFNAPTYELLSKNKQKLNTANYHRWWGEDKPGTIDLALRKRGYADSNLFMAMTTQKPVVGKSLRYCEKTDKSENETCNFYSQRWSYAIPLEVIYLSPLSKWNPYDIEYKGVTGVDDNTRFVKENGTRIGGTTKSTALNGTNSEYFYQTPANFFEGRNIGVYKGKGSVGVLDKSGEVRTVTASGIRALLPTIPGLGIIRMRYPIMPLHNDGNAVMKELDALKDIVMEQARYIKMFRDQPINSKPAKSKKIKGVVLEMSPATKSNTGPHVHRIKLTPEDIEVLQKGRPVSVITSEVHAHSHLVKLFYNPNRKNPWYIFRCDGKEKCPDGHRSMFEVRKFNAP